MGMELLIRGITFRFFVSIILISGSFVVLDLDGFIDVGNAEPTVLTVGESGSGAEYNSLLTAVNAASAGDTIKIWEGTYYEAVQIRKSLTLLGNGSGKTIIDGVWSNNVVYINANNVIIRNITIQNSNHQLSGIHLGGSQHCEIIECEIWNNGNGINIDSSYSNIIRNNTINSNVNNGILIEDGGGNHIENNNISINGNGILFDGGGLNHIFNNNITRNSGIGINNSLQLWDNYIYHNNIIYNTIQVLDDYNKVWNSSLGMGNYWSDYSGLDNGNNGRKKGDNIGDTNVPHHGVDEYPYLHSLGWFCPISPDLQKLDNYSSDGIYSVVWNPSHRAESYELEEDSHIDFSSPELLYAGIDTNFQIEGRLNGTYYYRVRGVNQYGPSTWSDYSMIDVDYPPETPKDFRIVFYQGGNALHSYWMNNQVDTSQYEIHTKTTGNWSLLATLDHPQNTYNYSGIADGVMYYFKIRAKDHRGQFSEFSEIISESPKDIAAPSPPKGVKVSEFAADFVRLSWDMNTENDVIGYNVYRNTDPDNEPWIGPLNENGPIENTGFLDETVSDLTDYYYSVTVVDEVPNESELSEIVQVSTPLGQRVPHVQSSAQDFSIIEDTTDSSSINLLSWFSDMNGDKMWFVCKGQKNIDVTMNRTSGVATLVPNPDWNGFENLTFTANDVHGQVSDTVMVTVIGVNDPPDSVDIEILIDGAQSRIYDDRPFSLRGSATDPDLIYGDKLEYSWSSGLSGDLGDGELLQFIYLEDGVHQIILKVSDLDGENILMSKEITVLPAESRYEDNDDYVPPTKKGDEKGSENQALMRTYVLLTSLIIISFTVVLLFVITKFKPIRIKKKKGDPS